MEGMCGFVAESKGQLMGLVLYDNWGADACHIHHILVEPYIIAQGWLGVMFGYPFKTRGCRKIFGMIPGYNTKALNFARDVGFSDITHIPDYYSDGGACHVLRMDRTDCKYIEDDDHG